MEVHKNDLLRNKLEWYDRVEERSMGFMRERKAEGENSTLSRDARDEVRNVAEG